MTGACAKRFADRVVIVTGASSGLGLAVARAFHREGARVVLTARNAARLRELADEMKTAPGNDVLAIGCDVARREEVDAMVATVIAAFGRVDILVNNAGIGLIAPLEGVQPDDARALFDTNFFGALHCIQAVLPAMTRERRGHIVNVTAVGGGIRAVPGSSIYGASKAALVALSDSLRIEVKPGGINVTTFCPGLIAGTNFFKSVKTYGPVNLWKLPDQTSADDAALALLDGVAKRKTLVLVTGTARAMYYLNRFFPRIVDRILHARMPKPASVDTRQAG